MTDDAAVTNRCLLDHGSRRGALGAFLGGHRRRGRCRGLGDDDRRRGARGGGIGGGAAGGLLCGGGTGVGVGGGLLSRYRGRSRPSLSVTRVGLLAAIGGYDGIVGELAGILRRRDRRILLAA